MYKYTIYLLFISFFLVQCGKKTTEGMMGSTNETVKKLNPVHAWRSAAPGPGTARKIELGEYNSFDLDNGLKVIMVENHKIPRVSYQLSLNNDQIIEGDQVGYVSMAGDLMGNGTKTKSKAEIDAAIDYIGANLSTRGSGIFASSLKKHKSKLLDIMTDVLYNPSFPKEEFKKLKTQAISGLANVKTNPNAIAGNVASVLNYGINHPYGEIQNEEHVNNMTLEKCKVYYDTYFKPNNAYLVIVGDINPAEAKADAIKYFGKWKRAPIPQNPYTAASSPKGRNVAFANKDGAVQSVIRITYPIDLKPGADDLVKARVMNNILGGGIFSGRLMQNLREDKAYTYGARSNVSSDELIGNFRAFASVRNAVTDSSVTEFLYEMRRLRDELISAADLQLVKNSMTGSFGRSLESPQTIARFARNTYKYNLPSDYYETYLQRLDAVTIPDVSAMAKKYIRPDNSYIVVVGSKDEVSANLKQFDSDGEIDFYDAFGTKLEMEDNPLPDGVNAMSVIKDYFSALGGNDKIINVKSIVTKMSMDIIGQSAGMEMGQKNNKMFYMEMSMGGQVMQEQRYDGLKGKIGGMGQNKIVTEGPEFDQMKEQSRSFSQLDYLKNESMYKLAIKGIEDVNGQKAYKVEIVKPNGEKSYEFYSVKSNFLLRNTTSTTGPAGQSKTIITDVDMYKEVDGIMFPHVITINGAMPFPLVMNIESIAINSDIPAAKFKVD